MIEIILPKENRIEVCSIDSLKSVILCCLNMVQYFVLASYWIKPDIICDLLHLCSCSVSDTLSQWLLPCAYGQGISFPSCFLTIFVPWCPSLFPALLVAISICV